jgi:hypothetical protein
MFTFSKRNASARLSESEIVFDPTLKQQFNELNCDLYVGKYNSVLLRIEMCSEQAYPSLPQLQAFTTGCCAYRNNTAS